MDEDLDKIIITLSLNQSFRPKLKKFLRYNCDVLYLWNEASFPDFVRAGLKEKDYNLFLDIKKKGYRDKEFDTFQKEKIRIIFYNDPEYPELLKHIKDFPPFIFVKGNIENKLSISIVGARKPSRYGLTVATMLAEKLAKAGITVASGLAMGIDALAQKAALSGHGKTIAVLGSGINSDSVDPRVNWYLSEKILECGGALISEYPPYYQVHKMNFPERNRIVSGLSRGVLIIEAREGSGALITADFALEQGRDIFAVPHDITRIESVGTNNLIKEGAVPVTSAEDILDYWGIEHNNKATMTGDTPREDAIIQILKEGTIHADQIAKTSGLTIEETSATLSLMEIKGHIVNQGAQMFGIKR